MRAIRAPGAIGSARIGSALVGVAMLLRADVPLEPPVQPQLQFEPPARGVARQRLVIPAAEFGQTRSLADPAIARGLPQPYAPPLRARLLASTGGELAGGAIHAAPLAPDGPLFPAMVDEPSPAPEGLGASQAGLAIGSLAGLAESPAPKAVEPQVVPAPAEALPRPEEAVLASGADLASQPPLSTVANDVATPALLPEPAFGCLADQQAPARSPSPPPRVELALVATDAPPAMAVVSDTTAEDGVMPAAQLAEATDDLQAVKPARRLVPAPQFGESTGAGPATPAPVLQATGQGPPAAMFAPAATGSTEVEPGPGSALADSADYFRKRPAPGAGQGSPQFAPDDELVLEIRTADGLQGDTVMAYGSRMGVYLPLGAMARFLDLAITVSDDGHFASGWFLSEERRLTLDLRQRVLEVAGKRVALTPSDAVAFEGELYLREDHFARIFPLVLKTDLRDQSIMVTTLEPFPFEERLAREGERARLAARGAKAGPQKWPREETPWQALGLPLADIEMRAMADRIMGKRVEGDLRLAGDLAYMTAQAFLSTSSRDGVTGARFSLGRQDPDADLLGPLGATEFQIGDVFTTPLPIGLRGTSGRGLFITNSPVESVSVFDKVDLRGALPDGYEVELYRNNMLIGSTRQAVNGQYEFLQVPVDFGMNVFRFVFYGPQGQRREDVRRISVGDGRIAPGRLTYSAGMVQKDMNLFDVRGPDFAPSQDFAAWRYAGQLTYGLTQGITATLGGAWFGSDKGRHWQVNAGIRTGIAGLATNFDVAAQDSGGRAASLGLGGTLFGMGFRAVHAEYRGAFIDEVRAYSSDPLRRATEVDLNAAMRLGGGLSPFTIPLSVRYRRLERLDGRKETGAMLRTSANVGRLLVSNTIDYTRTVTPGIKSNSQLLGAFDLASLSGSRTKFRTFAGYQLLPSTRLISAGLQVDREIDERMLLRGSIGHSFAESDTQLGFSAIRRFGQFTLAFDGNYGIGNRNYSAVLRLGFSLGHNPLTGRAFVTEPGLAGGGASLVQAYRDEHGDGQRGTGESVIPDVAFTTGSIQAVTDKAGQALLSGLEPGMRTSLQMDVETLPDIGLYPASRGVEIVPRPGRVHVSAFAVQALSEVEGTVYFAGNGRKRGVSGLSLRLLDSAGTVVGTVRSEADGFFLFEQIKPGQYTLDIDPAQAARLRIRLEQDAQLDISGKGGAIRRDMVVTAR